MFKNFIKRIAEAVLALIVPIITSTKNDIIAKMDAQSNEVTGIRNLVNSIIAKLQDNETCIKEMAKRLDNQESEIELLKSQLAEIKEQQTEIKEQLAESMEQQTEIKTQSEAAVEDIIRSVKNVEDNIPMEIKDKSQKQSEARVQKLLEVKHNEDTEKPDYDQMAQDIFNKCNEADVCIKDNLNYEVIHRLIANYPDITIGYEDGKILVAKKKNTDLEETDFDAEAVRQEFEKKKAMANRIKYNSLVERQLEFIKHKVRQQVEKYSINPYSYECILLSEPNEALSGRSQEASESIKKNPMYVNFPDGTYYFTLLNEISSFLKKQGMGLQLEAKTTSEHGFDQICGFYVVHNGKARYDTKMCLGRNTWYLENVDEVRLHIFTPDEKKRLGMN